MIHGARLRKLCFQKQERPFMAAQDLLLLSLQRTLYFLMLLTVRQARNKPTQISPHAVIALIFSLNNAACIVLS